VSEENPGDLTAVLVVDDNDTDAQFMKTVIEEAGYQVTTAAAADDGEALIVGQEWAIAFVDLMLPGTKTASRSSNPVENSTHTFPSSSSPVRRTPRS